jgi:hypothetical protein
VLYREYRKVGNAKQLMVEISYRPGDRVVISAAGVARVPFPAIKEILKTFPLPSEHVLLVSPNFGWDLAEIVDVGVKYLPRSLGKSRIEILTLSLKDSILY